MPMFEKINRIITIGNAVLLILSKLFAKILQTTLRATNVPNCFIYRLKSIGI